VPVRAALALTMTVIGVVLLMSFKTPETPAASPTAPVAVATGTGPTPGADTGAAAATPSGAVAGPAVATATAAASGIKDGNYTGQDYPNQFGDVQVKVIVSGGKITDVQALQLPSDRARSAEISQAAGPILHDEVLQAQSAQIDLLSGATYTSYSYQQSLQSALDQAK
jgi:uncharacterized protein with FMN-binding domain